MCHKYGGIETNAIAMVFVEEYFGEGVTPSNDGAILVCTETQNPGYKGKTDASETAIGAVLTHKDEGIERLVAYASCKLLPVEKRQTEEQAKDTPSNGPEV
ncbi:hypothetical protein Y1Q_0009887 [Alligator mississippiensis]|uniref:Reverse transcriptase/retrotransposon-derived protein RNase H-like domain-containing protein n=1 Tax=Alligator mississippiensis TaxID=8496 RepID=A0A151MX20_ALLMI|nr:hypothetical protein Y1Q_0009887 [Alligator mississippiensis]